MHYDIEDWKQELRRRLRSPDLGDAGNGHHRGAGCRTWSSDTTTSRNRGVPEHAAREEVLAMIEDGDRLSRNVNRAEHTGLSLLPKERWFTGHLHTLTGALRGLRASRGVSAIAILTMAVAIAANTAVFSVDDHEFVRTLVSMPDPQSLGRDLGSTTRSATSRHRPSRYRGMRSSAPRHNRSPRLASPASSQLHADRQRRPSEPLTGLRVSASFFSTLGVMPAFGRNFTEAEDVPNGPSVCVISSELWHTQFGGRNLVGETIDLNGMPWEVVGIMPPRLTAPFTQVQVFVPRVFEVSGLTQVQLDAGATYAQAIARLKPGTSLEQARAELAAFSRGYQERHPTRLMPVTRASPAPLFSRWSVTSRRRLHAARGIGVRAVDCVRERDRPVRQPAHEAAQGPGGAPLSGATRWRLITDFLIESAAIAACVASPVPCWRWPR